MSGLSLIVAMATATTLLAQDTPEFSHEWLIVKLRSPLSQLSTNTGDAALSETLRELSVQGIEKAIRTAEPPARHRESFKRLGLDRYYRFRMPEGSNIKHAMSRLDRLDAVELAEPDPVTRAAGVLVPDDTLFGSQWGLDQPSDQDVDAPEAWDITTGDSLTIAILDSGITNHADLSGKIVAGFDFVNNDNDPVDGFDHGTPIAAIAAAKSNNALGIAGICWRCLIMPVQIFNDQGTGLVSDLTNGTIFAVDNGASIVNFSGAAEHTSLLRAGIRYAYEAGVQYVGTSGNQTGPVVQFPGKYREVISTGGIDSFAERVSSSSYGIHMELVAPGDQVLAPNILGGYSTYEGTSFAAPFTTGLAALVRTIHPTCGLDEMQQLMLAAADDEVGPVADDGAGWDPEYGWGRLNLEQTLLGAQATTTLRLSGGAVTRLFFDTPNPLADSYDFIRGDLAALSESAVGGVSLGTTLCLENDSIDGDTLGNEDSAIPASGQAFFYLSRFNAGPWPGPYGGSSRNRDRRIPDPLTGADAQLTTSTTNAELGRSLDGLGDVNNDGFDDVILGAGDFAAPAGTGAAFVHLGSGSGLDPAPVWSITSTQAGSSLGRAVSGAGDINGDSFDDLIVGEQSFDNTVDGNEGRAFVYLGSASGPQVTPHVVLSDFLVNARFGSLVASAGDVNNDGFDDVLVVAQRYSGGQNNEGRAYLYHGSAGGLITPAAWTFEPNIAGTRLREAASAGDVNNDGFDDVLLGAPLFDGVDNNEGRAWLFLGSAAGLSAAPSTTLTLGGDGSNFGSTVASAGDVDNDGFDDVLITAVNYSNGEDGEGIALLYPGSAGGLITTPAWSFESDRRGAQISFASTAGDIDHDGFSDVIVGSGRMDRTRLIEGQAWLFRGFAGGLATTADWIDNGWQVDAQFGLAGAAAGDIDNDTFDDFMIGAIGFDSNAHNEGAVRIYNGSTGSLSRTVATGCDVPVP